MPRPVFLAPLPVLLLPDDRVIEVKTMARKWDETTLQQNLQLKAYHYAYRMLNGRSPTLEVVSLLKYKTPRVERLHGPAHDR